MYEPSPLKNVTGGGGCGCGCLGLLGVLLAGVVLMGIPLELYTESQLSTVTIGSIGTIVAGSVLFGVGAAMYVVSIFLE